MTAPGMNLEEIARNAEKRGKISYAEALAKLKAEVPIDPYQPKREQSMSPHTDAGALLPCPFCGGKAAIKSYGEDAMMFKAECQECTALIRGFDQCSQDAVDAWNARQAASQGSGEVSDERALALAHSISTGKVSAIQGACDIMEYATVAIEQEKRFAASHGSAVGERGDLIEQISFGMMRGWSAGEIADAILALSPPVKTGGAGDK